MRHNIPSGEESRLQELHRWLTLEGMTIGFGTFGFFLPMGLIFMLLKWGAIAFTPYMLWRLYQSRRFGWIGAFVLFVGIPAGLMLSRSEPGISNISGYFIYMLPLVTFYAYTWILRYSVGEWLEELKWKRHERYRNAISGRSW